MSRSRLNVYLERAHEKRLNELSAMRKVSKSAIIAAALSAFLLADGGEQREVVMYRRLDRLAGQFDRLERDQSILIETLALFIRHYLTVTVPVPTAHQDAARAQGRARFDQFMCELAKQLGRGRSLVRDVTPQSQSSGAAGRTRRESSTDASQGAS